MERKIGEIFEFGGEWYQCVEDKSCNRCAFKDTKCGDISNIKGYCSVRNRSDKKSVIFKKLEKVGESYMDGGKIMQKYKRVYREPIYFPYKELNCYNDLHGRICIEIKQNKEEMEEKYSELTDIVHEYMDKDMTYEYFKEAINYWVDDYNKSNKVTDKFNLKPFNLEKAKAGNPVCTRDGRKARIICFDRVTNSTNEYTGHLIVLVTNPNGDEQSFYYTEKGNLAGEDEYDNHKWDLMMLPEKKEGWINVYKMKESTFGYITAYFDTEEKAKEDKEQLTGYVATVKINWEE